MASGKGHPVAATDAVIPKYAYIDCLRGLAILLVIVMHHGQNFYQHPMLQYFTNFGQLGVQMFFVASALTLCMSARSRCDEAHPVASFYLRRLFRIAPLYYVAIALYCLIHGDLISGGWDPASDHYTVPNILANVALVHGFVPDAQNHIVPGGWSIGTEMAFYAVFPLVLPLADRLARRSFWLAVIGLPLAGLAANLAFQVVVSEATGSRMVNNGFLFYLILNQFPAFLIGISGFLLIERDMAPRSAVLPLASFLLASVLVLPVVNRWTPMQMALLPALSGMGFLGLAFALRLWRRKIGWIERIGQVSYSMYVFHFVLVWWLVPHLFAQDWWPQMPLPLAYVVTLAISVAGSYAIGRLSKRLVEEPFIALGNRIIRKLG